ncbi:hypothetical protein MUK42_14526 [Musa troglodytarum]|uniref:Uncharacterized protein n=1 Tax=Musa troglodytarum TaxID=320322 RepID=A0A9E7KQN3_9LILI|nr:hypothetical protein MUK42_14526 [Musa troglodytarum]
MWQRASAPETPTFALASTALPAPESMCSHRAPRNHLPEGKQMPSFTLFGALCLFGSPGLGPKRKKRRAVSLVPLLPKELRNEHLRGFVIQTTSATNDADFRRLR